MRFKNRYILAEFIFDDGQVDQSLTTSHIFKQLREQIELEFGDVGAGLVQHSLNVKYYNPITGLAIVRVIREYLHLAKHALLNLNAVRDRTVVVRTLHVAGTIRRCQEVAISHNRRMLLQADREKVFGSSAGPARVRIANKPPQPQTDLNGEDVMSTTGSNAAAVSGRDALALAPVLHVASETGEPVRLFTVDAAVTMVKSEKALVELDTTRQAQ